MLYSRNSTKQHSAPLLIKGKMGDYVLAKNYFKTHTEKMGF
jgi:hypothetical protein